MDNIHDPGEALHCAGLLRTGKVIVYPTDTVWGVGCDALNPDAVRRVFDLKRRPATKSMILLLADTAELNTYVSGLNQELLEKIGRFAEPTTIVFGKAQNLPEDVLANDGSVAIRISSDPFCTAMIRALQRPLVSTSANLSGQPAAAVFSEIDPQILEGADYVVRHRQQDTRRAAPSHIFRLAADGSLIRIR